MRRMILGYRDERGAIGILVAVLMVVLLGFAALAVDVGLMYSERAQLQNGADAAALSIAETCAMDGNPLCNEASALTMAKSYANGNANDGLTRVQSVELSDAIVTVTTGAMEEGGEANMLSLYFAKILGNSSTEIGAVAEAGWGGYSKDSAPFSIAFSKCEVDSTASADGNFQFLRSHGIDDTDASCHGTSSGSEIPGGFGWLAQADEGSCSVDIDLADPTMAGDPGDNLKAGCAERLDKWKALLVSGEPITELFPVFDDTNGETGSAGAFHLHSFAAFEVHGWNFAGHKFMLPDAAAYFAANGYVAADRGFIGKFVRYVGPGEAEGFGGSTEYGAKAVSLTK